MLPCVDEHFPVPLAPEGTEEQLASRGSAPASLPLDANKPLTFKQVPLLVETRGVPSAHFSAPRDSCPLQEGREEDGGEESTQRHQGNSPPSSGGEGARHPAAQAPPPSPGSIAPATAAIKAHPERRINVRFASNFPCAR